MYLQPISSPKFDCTAYKWDSCNIVKHTFKCSMQILYSSLILFFSLSILLHIQDYKHETDLLHGGHISLLKTDKEKKLTNDGQRSVAHVLWRMDALHLSLYFESLLKKLPQLLFSNLRAHCFSLRKSSHVSSFE